jgi:hypothetical protein
MWAAGGGSLAARPPPTFLIAQIIGTPTNRAIRRGQVIWVPAESLACAPLMLGAGMTMRWRPPRHPILNAVPTHAETQAGDVVRERKSPVDSRGSTTASSA